MARTRVHTFAVHYPIGDLAVQGFLDMLRYEQCRVLAHDPRHVILVVEGHPPEHGRWASFGLPVLADAVGPEPLPEVVRMQLRGTTPDGLTAAEEAP